MIREIRAFTYVVSSEDFVLLPAEYCKEAGTGVLWNNAGCYGIVSHAEIRNEYIKLARTQLPKLIAFFWKSAIPVSAVFVKLLLGENHEDKCTYSRKSSPPGH